MCSRRFCCGLARSALLPAGGFAAPVAARARALGGAKSAHWWARAPARGWHGCCGVVLQLAGQAVCTWGGGRLDTAGLSFKRNLTNRRALSSGQLLRLCILPRSACARASNYLRCARACRAHVVCGGTSFGQALAQSHDPTPPCSAAARGRFAKRWCLARGENLACQAELCLGFAQQRAQLGMPHAVRAWGPWLGCGCLASSAARPRHRSTFG